MMFKLAYFRPPLMGIKGLEATGLCQPARTIGGDYYDLLNLRDGSFAISVGDVSEKGIPAAVMMANIQMLLRNNLQQQGSERLPTILANLNQTLYENSTAERYSTLFCGVISPDRSTLSYVNAGHVPPALLHEDGQIELLQGNDIPVGLLRTASYEERCIQLRQKDTIIIVSDGIIESRNQEGDFWEQVRFEQALMQYSTEPLSDIPGLLCREAQWFAGVASQYDDMTVVAIRISE